MTSTTSPKPDTGPVAGTVDGLGPLHPPVVLARAEAAVTARREAEVAELRCCLAWADLHASDPREEPGRRGELLERGGERLVDLGGDGTPQVRDLALLELGVALCRHPLAVRSMTADVLDLRHRLPRTWAAVQDGEAEAWLARKVAALSRPVPLDRVHVVDAAVAAAIAGVAPSRLLDIAAAAVIHADPVGHRGRELVRDRRRYVALDRPDASGLRTLVARLAAGEALVLDGLVDRVAEILADIHRAQHTDTDTDIDADTDAAHEGSCPTHESLRADALARLADPAGLLRLLTEHGLTTGDLSPADLEAERAAYAAVPLDASWTSPVTDIPEPCDPDQPDPVELAAAADREPEPEVHRPSRRLALEADVLDRLTPALLATLRPRAMLYVHLHQAALADDAILGLDRGPGVLRPEGLAPMDLLQLRALLGRHEVRVTPVIDNTERHAVDAYEHPPWLRERIHLDQPADAFPHASRRGRALDLDHPVPWNPGGPPGQTTTDSQPLSRTAHRARTHLGYTITPTPAGIVWRTPHGLHRLVDNDGVTHRISRDDADVLVHGETGVDRLLDRVLERYAAEVRPGGTGCRDEVCSLA